MTLPINTAALPHLLVNDWSLIISTINHLIVLGYFACFPVMTAAKLKKLRLIRSLGIQQPHGRVQSLKVCNTLHYLVLSSTN
jgi:hypothetical protein